MSFLTELEPRIVTEPLPERHTDIRPLEVATVAGPEPLNTHAHLGDVGLLGVTQSAGESPLVFRRTPLYRPHKNNVLGASALLA